MTAEQKIKYLPAGGIAGFVMSDEQVEQLEAEELQEQYGTAGIAQFSTIGKNMANFGRHGDDTVAHVETGELIVPRALIENNPKLKESIFQHLRELGVEDPERYVVGESKNSLNPTTGLPEFFFKKLFKSVSKTVKSVGKILKKAAPIILPIALAFTPLGPIYGAMVGSGLGTLINGGSIKDAAKSALIAGAFAGISVGVSGGSVGDALANPAGKFSATGTGLSNTFSSGSFTGPGELFGPTLPPVESQFGLRSVNASNNLNPDLSYSANTNTIDMSSPDGTIRTLDANNNVIRSYDASGNLTTTPKTKSMFETFTDKASEYGSKTSDLMFGTDATQAELFAKAGQFQKDALAKGYTLSSKEAMALAQKQLNPGIIRKYGPSLALAGVAGVAGGMFDTPKEEEDKPIRTGMDVYNENPDIYNVGDLEPIYIPGDSNVGTKYPYYRPRNVQTVAQGGQIFPRRVGGIMPNEGIPNQDSVRAMLMPGEFVMTTDAVKGLGGGDMNKGINNMYGVMRNLEQRGRRA